MKDLFNKILASLVCSFWLPSSLLYQSAPPEYDLIIVGAGASGLFASGVASSLGQKVLLLDANDHILGGDCTNAACVPSKAVRSISRVQHGKWGSQSIGHGKEGLQLARLHSSNTVNAVRQREDPRAMRDLKNLDLLFCKEVRFVSNQEIEVQARNETTTRRIRSKKFLISTGASPKLPESIVKQANAANLPIYTYRSILSPESNSTKKSIWNLLDDITTHRIPQIVIAGGGPTSCELGQALARLGGKDWNVTIIAPGLLLSEDISLQRAAMQLLQESGVNVHLGKRLNGVTTTGLVVLDNGSTLPANALVLCLGRNPSVTDLGLEAAGIDWTEEDGILVNKRTLRSTSNRHVFASGDCCSAVQGNDRTAAHAGWTGYHAARNIAVPWILRVGAKSVHTTVPSVIFSDPELASVGMSKIECIQRYGSKGFASLSVSEQGMDRGDMDRLERNTNITFVELWATKVTGRILGLTACGQSSAELANEIGVAIQNGLTVRDLARSIHAYPSHGYLLYRLSLALATDNLWGLLATFGPVGAGIGMFGRHSSSVAWACRPENLIPWKRHYCRKIREWEAIGEGKTMLIDTDQRLCSYLDIFNNLPNRYLGIEPDAYTDWVKSRPKKAFSKNTSLLISAVTK